ncbi:hypothetical protein ACWGDS_11050 [Streptomyces sp. NPDC055059]
MGGGRAELAALGTEPTGQTLLERVRNGGAYQPLRPPPDRWEWRKQFPELGYLLAGYFHQDFSRFYVSHR